MNISKTFILFTILIILIGCEELPTEPECDNPMDPNCPNYISPLASILTPPSPAADTTITNNYVTFAWCGVQSGSDFQYKLDGVDVDNTWSNWGAAITVYYDNLSDETTYTFFVREKYTSGDVQETPTSRTFTVNYADPQAMIDVGPDEGATINTNYVTFSWYGVQSGSDFQYKLDGVDVDNTWSNWGAAITVYYDNLSDETTYTFFVREKYTSGDVQETPTSRTFTVNYADPQAMIDVGPDEGATINTNYVTFSWYGVQSGSDFQYKLDGVDTAWSNWGAAITVYYDNLSDETTYTFFVREKYTSGDVQETPTSRTFTVNYADPQAMIDVGPDEGATINTNYVTFSWYGVQSGSDFQYKLDGVDTAWSNWGANTETTYSYLDEGSYTFYVRERYNTGYEQEQTTSRSFTVDAITGPALVMKKQLVQVSNYSSFTVEIMVEEVTDLMGILIKIEFDQDSLEVSAIEQGNFFGTDNPEGIAFITNSITEANEGGSVEINTSRLGGEPPGINGTGTIAKVIFQANITGETEISFSTEDACQMRDSYNNNIFINERIGTRVKIN